MEGMATITDIRQEKVSERLELELGRLTEWKRQKGSRTTNNIRLRELRNETKG